MAAPRAFGSCYPLNSDNRIVLRNDDRRAPPSVEVDAVPTLRLNHSSRAEEIGPRTVASVIRLTMGHHQLNRLLAEAPLLASNNRVGGETESPV